MDRSRDGVRVEVGTGVKVGTTVTIRTGVRAWEGTGEEKRVRVSRYG